MQLVLLRIVFYVRIWQKAEESMALRFTLGERT